MSLLQSKLGFYVWAYENVDSVNYALDILRNSYPDSDIVISSDNGADFTNTCEMYSICHYIHGAKSHGSAVKSLETGNYGWTVNEAFLWLDRLYEACTYIKNDFVMLMEEDVLVKERFKFPNADIIMIPGIKNVIGNPGMTWLKSVGGKTNYPYYSAGGGSIINRKAFIDAYNKHASELRLKYTELYNQSMSEGAIGWGWNDSIICVLMYANNCTISTDLPISESGNEADPFPIIHKFKKYYKNLNATS